MKTVFNIFYNVYELLEIPHRYRLYLFLLFSLFLAILDLSILYFIHILFTTIDHGGEITLPFYKNNINTHYFQIFLSVYCVLCLFLRILFLKYNSFHAFVLGHYAAMSIFKSILNKEFSYLSSFSNSHLIACFSTKLNDFVQNLFVPMINLLVALIMIILVGSFIFIKFFSFYIIIAVLFIFISYSIFIKISKSKYSFNSSTVAESRVTQANQIQDLFSNKIEFYFSSKSERIRDFIENDLVIRSRLADSVFWGQLPRHVVEYLFIITILFFTFTDNNFDVSSIITISLGVFRFLPYFNLFYRSYANILSNQKSFQDLLDLKNKSSVYDDISQFDEEKFSINKIELINISFSYDKNVLFKNYNLIINKNEKVCIYGKTGSGKSTLLGLISGLYYPDSGSILINNTNSLSLKSSKFYSSICYLSQNVYLSNDTLIKNITGSNKNLDPSLFTKVCEVALVNDFVNLNSDEIYRKVGDYGLKFSGGQIIRIGIARALYRSGISLYIFDEITSGLDHNTSLKLLKNLNMFLSNTIVIYVSHNINLYSEFNTVINLNDLN